MARKSKWHESLESIKNNFWQSKIRNQFSTTVVQYSSFTVSGDNIPCFACGLESIAWHALECVCNAQTTCPPHAEGDECVLRLTTVHSV